MSDTKKWYESSGVWGGAIAFLAPVLAWLGYTVTADDAQQLAGAAASIAATIGAVGSAVGGVMAIVGRIRASKVIK
jgi:hypothetical protein